MTKSFITAALLVLFSTSVVSADLMKEPAGALKGKKHLQYASIHEKITDCEQSNDNRWRLRKYPIKLGRYKYQSEFYSPFTSRGGSSCRAGFNQRFNGNININTAVPTIVDAQIGGDCGKRSRDNDIAEIWWTVATSHAVHDPYSSQSDKTRKTLMTWANENALSKNINVPWGNKPVGYEVIVMIPRLRVVLLARHRGAAMELLNHGCPHKSGSMKRKMSTELRIIKLLHSHFAKIGTVTNYMPARNGRALLVLLMH